MSDSDILRAAARILRRESKRPNFWLNVLCRVLNDTATKVERPAPRPLPLRPDPPPERPSRPGTFG